MFVYEHANWALAEHQFTSSFILHFSYFIALSRCLDGHLSVLASTNGTPLAHSISELLNTPAAQQRTTPPSTPHHHH